MSRLQLENENSNSMMGLRYRKAICFKLFFLISLLFLIVYLSRQFLMHEPWFGRCPWQLSHRDFIVRKLRNAIVRLQTHTNREHWTLQTTDDLIRILRIFGNEEFGNLKQSGRLETQVQQKDSSDGVFEACPEIFTHSNRSEPYFLEGTWIKPSTCYKEKPLEDLLTVVIHRKITSTDCDTLSNFLNAMHHLHQNVKVLVSLNDSSCYLPHVHAITSRNDVSSAHSWNDLFTMVNTPYVLVDRGLEDISWFTRLRRQISIMADPLVYVVGGSFRNRTGHWQKGCYQTRTRQYILAYDDGYYDSKSECLFCDYLVGPFIARTTLFYKHRFDESLEDDVIFDDLFLRLRRESVLVMNCPDAMYYATDKTIERKVEKRKSWLSLMKKWQLNRLWLPDGTRHTFTCNETNFVCSHLHGKSGVRFMPLCCADRILKGLDKFHQFCKRHGLLYYVNGGTLLGSVKFQNTIPWDFDGDGIYYLPDYSVFLNDKNMTFGDNKTIFFGDFNLKWYGYFRVMLPDIFLELDGLNETAVDKSPSAEMFRKTPTLVKIRDKWFYGPPSPALYARNMYGKELFKHSNSWAIQKHLWFDPYVKQDHFQICNDPNHHACYDYLPTDGSFLFMVE